MMSCIWHIVIKHSASRLTAAYHDQGRVTYIPAVLTPATGIKIVTGSEKTRHIGQSMNI